MQLEDIDRDIEEIKQETYVGQRPESDLDKSRNPMLLNQIDIEDIRAVRSL